MCLLNFQMENIQVYLNFCEKLGMSKTSLFQTVDLYEGRNMAQFLTAVQQLGTEASVWTTTVNAALLPVTFTISHKYCSLLYNINV